MRDRRPAERGTVLVVCLGASVLIAGLSYCFLSSVVIENDAQRGRTELVKCTHIAESAAADVVTGIVPTLDVGMTATLGRRSAPIAFGGGAYWARVTAEGDRTFTVVASATYGRSSVAIETRWGREFHPVRDYAIFSGNRSASANGSLVLGGTGSNRDVVNGKVYVHGDLDLAGHSEVHGTAVATGSITGNAVDGETRENAPAFEAPDLSLMRYHEIADFKVDASAPFDVAGRIPRTDPRHIFVRNFRTDLSTRVGFRFDNVNYFLGDPYESSSIDRISVSYDGNEKIYFVDGNVWVEPMGDTSRIVKSPVDGTRITIVARGNIYLCDGLQYEDPQHDAILFIALTDGESYTDLNGNNQYDAGEPILHDDGDGVYEGPREGSGNIHFGDPNGGGLGNVHGFMYADNYFQDHVLDGPNGQPIPFGVTGFMSAGEQVRIKRDYNGRHAKMTVNFDPRVVDGSISMPGFPEREAQGELSLLSWRLLGQAE